MLLIATDEAGYGPKLGPLVICATAWSIPDAFIDQAGVDQADYHSALQFAFAPLREPMKVGETTIAVDDSKAVYKPKPSANATDPLAKLHLIVSLANRWAGASPNLTNWLNEVSPMDLDQLKRTPWLAEIQDIEFARSKEAERVLQAWQSSGIELLDMKARILTAAKFNEACSSGMNKADLLSESSLTMVRDLIRGQANQFRCDASHSQDPSNSNGSNPAIRVFCDRHGGRRYYAGVLQHVFTDATTVQVAAETKHCSAYRLTFDGDLPDSFEASIEFTVKGDRFSPVAMSSIIAKYIRERMMQTFNDYFQRRFNEQSESPADHASVFRPTAGYPTDADRFLKDIASVIDSNGIALDQLIRQR